MSLILYKHPGLKAVLTGLPRMHTHVELLPHRISYYYTRDFQKIHPMFFIFLLIFPHNQSDTANKSCSISIVRTRAGFCKTKSRCKAFTNLSFIGNTSPNSDLSESSHRAPLGSPHGRAGKNLWFLTERAAAPSSFAKVPYFALPYPLRHGYAVTAPPVGGAKSDAMLLFDKSQFAGFFCRDDPCGRPKRAPMIALPNGRQHGPFLRVLFSFFAKSACIDPVAAIVPRTLTFPQVQNPRSIKKTATRMDDCLFE